MEIEEFIEKIDKHIRMNECMALMEVLKGDDEQTVAHIGAMTGLKMLKKDLKREFDL